MPTERYEKGLAARKAVLGEEYVERNLAQADDFNQEFQALVTEFCWGGAWANDTLTFRERDQHVVAIKHLPLVIVPLGTAHTRFGRVAHVVVALHTGAQDEHGDRLTAGAADASLSAVNLDRQIAVGRNRQRAVEAVFRKAHRRWRVAAGSIAGRSTPR